MELTLLETKRRTKTKTLLGVGATSLTLHAVVIAAAVYATLSARPADTVVRIDGHANRTAGGAVNARKRPITSHTQRRMPNPMTMYPPVLDQKLPRAC